ncbi:MAG: cell division protein ZapA [Candidatus Sumerlaeales bacterium]|nr:cell division protein ZapA [Candidatus Sumerlaeales bacterium]
MMDERLEITLHGQLFRLRAPVEEHDRLTKAANYVNEVMAELSSMTIGHATVDTATLALQAAFRISNEYFKLIELNNAEAPEDAFDEAKVEKRLQAVNEILDDLLIKTSAKQPIITKAVPSVEEISPKENMREEEDVTECLPFEMPTIDTGAKRGRTTHRKNDSLG